MINHVRIAGALGADASIKSFQNGDRMISLRVACNEKWRDASGELRETTSWFTVCVFGAKRVERLQHLRKGQLVEVDGRLRTRKWQKDGRDQWTTEVVVDGPTHRCWVIEGRKAQGGSDGAAAPEAAELEDEVPY